MRYTANSTETNFREIIKILLQRLKIVHQKFEQKTIEFDTNGRNYETISKTIFKNDPHCLPNYVYDCKRTKAKNKGFGLMPAVLSYKRLQKLNSNHPKFLPIYFARIANGCQIVPSRPIP